MSKISRNAVIGYSAGIITGIAYGLNPLFAVPLINNGAEVGGILFFRYLFAVLILGGYLKFTEQSFKISLKQGAVLLALGLFFTLSSITLFESYNYIPSGLATTLGFLFPAFVAIIMVFLKVVPSWPVWLAIAATFGGVMLMSQGSGGESISPLGLALGIASAFLYALFVVVINRSKALAEISNTLLTFYALTVGLFIFAGQVFIEDIPLLQGISTVKDWLNLIGLAIIPTIVSTSTLAIATRNIGATKASVLGVFEPITAIMVGAIAFGEPLTVNIISGILIAVAAVTFMIYVTKR